MQEPVGFQLSPQQKRIWHLQEKGQPLASQIALGLEGPFESERLRAALKKVVERHEILRTGFLRPSGLKFGLQVVHSNADPKWEQVDLRAVAPAELESQLIPVLTAAKLDLGADGGMLHAFLAILPANHGILVLTLPALCADPATLKNLVAELLRFYGEEAPEGADPLQYADYSEWQNELQQKDDEESAAGKEYWAGYKAAQIPALSLPFSRKPETAGEFQAETIAIALDPQVASYLHGAADASDFLLACWQTFLWRMTGQAEVVVGCVSDGRSHEELGTAFGVFAKALPVYANFDADPTLTELMEQTGHARSEAVSRQDYFTLDDAESLPVGFSSEEKAPARSASGVTFSVFQQRNYVNGFQLELRCLVHSGNWQAELVFDPARLRREAVEVLARRFATLLTSAVANPNAAVSSLPSMDSKERQQVISAFNQTKADYPRGKCIHELFEQQATRYPNRPALRCGEQEFSYAQLNSRANQLAHFLRKNGVGTNTAVGLCVERSAEMIIGLLGILKAGGCYVPLVPDNPKARLAHQLTETKAPVILTQKNLLENLPEFAGKVICLDRDAALFQHEPRVNPQILNSP
jgi:hypothetical protein